MSLKNSSCLFGQVLALLVACSPRAGQLPSTQTNTNANTSASTEVTTTQPAETTVSSLTASSVTNIDGTYKGQDEEILPRCYW